MHFRIFIAKNIENSTKMLVNFAADSSCIAKRRQHRPTSSFLSSINVSAAVVVVRDGVVIERLLLLLLLCRRW